MNERWLGVTVIVMDRDGSPRLDKDKNPVLRTEVINVASLKRMTDMGRHRVIDFGHGEINIIEPMEYIIGRRVVMEIAQTYDEQQAIYRDQAEKILAARAAETHSDNDHAVN